MIYGGDNFTIYYTNKERYSMTIIHKHHIVPKHMGGIDDSSNLIELTVEEHAMAHKELWEQYGKEYDRIAWLSLSKQIDNAEARILSVIEWNKNRTVSEETREKTSKSLKEYYSIPENREKTSKATKEGMEKWWSELSEDDKNDWIARCASKPEGYIYPSGWTYSHSERAKKSISEFQKTFVKSDEHKRNISKNRKGKGTGEGNAMADPINREKQKQACIGRRKMLRPDGTWYWGRP